MGKLELSGAERDAIQSAAKVTSQKEKKERTPLLDTSRGAGFMLSRGADVGTIQEDIRRYANRDVVHRGRGAPSHSSIARRCRLSRRDAAQRDRGRDVGAAAQKQASGSSMTLDGGGIAASRDANVRSCLIQNFKN